MKETIYHLPIPEKLAFLSDTHNIDPRAILTSLKQQRPDVIAISGDFVRGEWAENKYSKLEESPNSLLLLKGCAEIAPTYISMGNHERSLTLYDLNLITNTGVILLDNTFTEHNGICLGGLSSAYFTECRIYQSEMLNNKNLKQKYPYLRRKPPEPDISILDAFEKETAYKILLCHHPEYYLKYLKNRKIDLILSGHCHGGQWCYYSILHREWRGLYAPGQGLFPSLTSGIYDGRMVVSRGLSNTTFIPRINNPEEIIYLIPFQNMNQTVT